MGRAQALPYNSYLKPVTPQYVEATGRVTSDSNINLFRLISSENGCRRMILIIIYLPSFYLAD